MFPILARLIRSGFFLQKAEQVAAEALIAAPNTGRMVSLVTGASSGIGRAIVEELAELTIGRTITSLEAGSMEVVYPELICAGARSALPRLWQDYNFAIRSQRLNLLLPRSIGQFTRFAAREVETCLGVSAKEVEEVILCNHAGVSDASWELLHQTNVLGPVRMVRATRRAFPNARIRNFWTTSIFETEGKSFGNLDYKRSKDLAMVELDKVAEELGGIENVRVSFGPVAGTNVFDATPTPGMMLLQTIRDREKNRNLWAHFIDNLTPYEPRKETTIHYLEAMLRNRGISFPKYSRSTVKIDPDLDSPILQRLQNIMDIVEKKDPHLNNPKLFQAMASALRAGTETITYKRGGGTYTRVIPGLTQRVTINMLVEGECITPCRIAGQQFVLTIGDKLRYPDTSKTLYPYYNAYTKYLLDSLELYLKGG